MKLILKEFKQEDYQNLIKWIKTPEFLLQWSGTFFKYPLTAEQLDEYRKPMLQKNSTRKIYSVFESNSNTHIGHIELNNIDLINKSARICRVLVGDVNSKGKGYGKEIVRSIIKIGFEELNLHRIDLGVFDFNTSAIKCYESVGFIREGVARESKIHGNEFWNLLQMSILEQEYKKIINKQYT